MHPDTWLISQGRPTASGQPLNAPPVLASNFRLPGDRYYNRTEGTETQEAFEALIGGLEGGSALAYGSGMAAVAAVFSLLPVGSTIVIPEDPYHATNGLAVEGEQQAAGPLHDASTGLQAEGDRVEHDDGGDRPLEPTGFQKPLDPAEQARLQRGDPPQVAVPAAGSTK